MLTIGQLAAHAGITVRTVRHYHAKGLLPEPERDSSGYRRYDARAVADLIKIRTLAGAGVPLAQVRELLQADDEQLAEAVAEIDHRLRAEIRERQRHRERIRRLAAGDSLALPPEAVAYLDRLRELGLSERMVAGERDAWILVAAHSPEQMPTLMALKCQEMEKPGIVELYKRLDEAIDWQPDDPRLPELVDRLVSLMADAGGWEQEAPAGTMAIELVELLDSFFVDAMPVGRRMLQLLEERGWSGWTQIEPTRADARR